MIVFDHQMEPEEKLIISDANDAGQLVILFLIQKFIDGKFMMTATSAGLPYMVRPEIHAIAISTINAKAYADIACDLRHKGYGELIPNDDDDSFRIKPGSMTSNPEQDNSENLDALAVMGRLINGEDPIVSITGTSTEALNKAKRIINKVISIHIALGNSPWTISAGKIDSMTGCSDCKLCKSEQDGENCASFIVPGSDAIN